MTEEKLHAQEDGRAQLPTSMTLGEYFEYDKLTGADSGISGIYGLPARPFDMHREVEIAATVQTSLRNKAPRIWWTVEAGPDLWHITVRAAIKIDGETFNTMQMQRLTLWVADEKAFLHRLLDRTAGMIARFLCGTEQYG
jgi:hypothetical protein